VEVLNCFAHGSVDLIFVDRPVSFPALVKKSEDLCSLLGELLNLPSRNNPNQGFAGHLQDLFAFFRIETFKKVFHLSRRIVDRESLGDVLFSLSTSRLY